MTLVGQLVGQSRVGVTELLNIITSTSRPLLARLNNSSSSTQSPSEKHPHLHKPINMSSNPGARCCTIGVTHEGQAKGELKDIEDGTSAPLPHPSGTRL